MFEDDRVYIFTERMIGLAMLVHFTARVLAIYFWVDVDV